MDGYGCMLPAASAVQSGMDTRTVCMRSACCYRAI